MNEDDPTSSGNSADDDVDAESGGRQANLRAWATDAGFDPDRLYRAESLIENAEQIAPNIRIPRVVLKHVYEFRRRREISLRAWSASVQRATVMESILRGFLRSAPLDAYGSLIDPGAMGNLAAALGTGSGTLVLTFHGGFATLSRRHFAELPGDPLTIAPREDFGAALFEGRRALLDGRPALIAPDGVYGKRTGTIDVMGATHAIADGAAFLAYDARCATLWLRFARGPKGFHPVIARGPQREGDETFAVFRDRLHAFYAAQIEACFSGAPHSVTLTTRWIRAFYAVARKERPATAAGGARGEEAADT